LLPQRIDPIAVVPVVGRIRSVRMRWQLVLVLVLVLVLMGEESRSWRRVAGRPLSVEEQLQISHREAAILD